MATTGEFLKNKNLLTFPIGKIGNRVLTNYEIDFIRTYNIGNVKVINGYYYEPKHIEYPFREYINYLYNYRIIRSNRCHQLEGQAHYYLP